MWWGKQLKKLSEGLKELGKHLLNIGVAIIVFAIIQPLVNGKFQIGTAILFIIAYFTVVVIGTILIIEGGNKDE